MKRKWKLSGLMPWMIMLVIVASGPMFRGPAAKAAISEEGPRIAVVDITGISEHSTTLMEFKAGISNELSDVMRPLMAKQEELRKVEENLEKQKVVLSDEEIAAMNDKKVRLLAEIKGKQSSMDEFRDYAGQKMAVTYDRIVRAVGEVARSGGYTIVLKREDVLYGAPEIDISDEVVSILDREVPASAGAESATAMKATPIPLRNDGIN